MCEICKDVKLYDYFNLPSEFLECNAYMRELVASRKFKLSPRSMPLDKIKDKQGCWVDDAFTHIIICKACGQHFTCIANTYRGGGCFRVGG